MSNKVYHSASRKVNVTHRSQYNRSMTFFRHFRLFLLVFIILSLFFFYAHSVNADSSGQTANSEPTIHVQFSYTSLNLFDSKSLKKSVCSGESCPFSYSSQGDGSYYRITPTANPTTNNPSVPSVPKNPNSGSKTPSQNNQKPNAKTGNDDSKGDSQNVQDTNMRSYENYGPLPDSQNVQDTNMRSYENYGPLSDSQTQVTLQECNTPSFYDTHIARCDGLIVKACIEHYSYYEEHQRDCDERIHGMVGLSPALCHSDVVYRNNKEACNKLFSEENVITIPEPTKWSDCQNNEAVYNRYSTECQELLKEYLKSKQVVSQNHNDLGLSDSSSSNSDDDNLALFGLYKEQLLRSDVKEAEGLVKSKSCSCNAGKDVAADCVTPCNNLKNVYTQFDDFIIGVLEPELDKYKCYKDSKDFGCKTLYDRYVADIKIDNEAGFLYYTRKSKKITPPATLPNDVKTNEEDDREYITRLITAVNLMSQHCCSENKLDLKTDYCKKEANFIKRMNIILSLDSEDYLSSYTRYSCLSYPNDRVCQNLNQFYKATNYYASLAKNWKSHVNCNGKPTSTDTLQDAAKIDDSSLRSSINTLLNKLKSLKQCHCGLCLDKSSTSQCSGDCKSTCSELQSDHDQLTKDLSTLNGAISTSKCDCSQNPTGNCQKACSEQSEDTELLVPLAIALQDTGTSTPTSSSTKIPDEVAKEEKTDLDSISALKKAINWISHNCCSENQLDLNKDGCKDEINTISDIEKILSSHFEFYLSEYNGRSCLSSPNNNICLNLMQYYTKTHLYASLAKNWKSHVGCSGTPTSTLTSQLDLDKQTIKKQISSINDNISNAGCKCTYCVGKDYNKDKCTNDPKKLTTCVNLCNSLNDYESAERDNSQLIEITTKIKRDGCDCKKSNLKEPCNDLCSRKSQLESHKFIEMTLAKGKDLESLNKECCSNKGGSMSDECKNVNCVLLKKEIAKTNHDANAVAEKEWEHYHNSMNGIITQSVDEAMQKLNLNSWDVFLNGADYFIQKAENELIPKQWDWATDVYSAACNGLTHGLCNRTKLTMEVTAAYHKAWVKAALHDFTNQELETFGTHLSQQFTMDGTKYTVNSLIHSKKYDYLVKIYCGWKGNFSITFRTSSKTYHLCYDKSTKKISMKLSCGHLPEAIFGFQDSTIKRFNVNTDNDFKEYCITFSHHDLTRFGVAEPFCLDFHAPKVVTIEGNGHSSETTTTTSGSNSNVITTNDVTVTS